MLQLTVVIFSLFSLQFFALSHIIGITAKLEIGAGLSAERSEKLNAHKKSIGAFRSAQDAHPRRIILTAQTRCCFEHYPLLYFLKPNWSNNSLYLVMFFRFKYSSRRRLLPTIFNNPLRE
jgi:hypothetical protein